MLREKQNHGDARFTVDHKIFAEAQSQTMFGHTALEPFTAAMFDLDPLDTNMDMLHHLIQKAKTSDLNQGAKQQSRSTFINARSVAVLATLDGKEVSGSAVSPHVRVQYFYQDDEKTKSLCTPFSQLILFANTNEQDMGAPEEEQLLVTAKPSLNNWIALRAAFEFDIRSERFRHDTEEFAYANRLLAEEGIAEFINDTPRRFSEVFKGYPDTIFVSHLKALCDKMAKRTGACSAWLLREMVSRCIAKGARVESSGGQGRNDGNGQLDLDIRHMNGPLPDCTKVLDFDCKVNLEGLNCRVMSCGKVELVPRKAAGAGVFIRVLFKDQQQALDDTTALKWLKRGKGVSISASKFQGVDLLGPLPG
jgi:hypothetical protein